MFCASFFILFASYLVPVYAACPENIVPNPLDPNCDRTQPITIGSLLNQVLVFLPFIIGVIFAGSFLYGAVRVAVGGEEGREEGIKWMINVVIGAVAIGLLWVIMFFVSIFTGVDLLSALGL